MNPQLRLELNRSMEMLCDGDRNAFDFVFEKTLPLVNRLANKMIGYGPDAEDVAQQVLLKVFSRAQEFEKGRDALSWILGITAFECKTVKQKVRRRKENFDTEGSFESLIDPRRSAEDEKIKNDLETSLRELLSEMNLQEQETILASVDEISRPNIGGATYRKRLQRAMDRLRNKWRDRYD